jgi:hypothetical protein
MKQIGITFRISQPSPQEIRAARKKTGLTQAGAAQLISPAKGKPYRSWQSYEVAEDKPGARAIPLASWELFLLLTDQHPTHQMIAKNASSTGESGE